MVWSMISLALVTESMRPATWPARGIAASMSPPKYSDCMLAICSITLILPNGASSEVRLVRSAGRQMGGFWYKLGWNREGMIFVGTGLCQRFFNFRKPALKMFYKS